MINIIHQVRCFSIWISVHMWLLTFKSTNPILFFITKWRPFELKTIPLVLLECNSSSSFATSSSSSSTSSLVPSQCSLSLPQDLLCWFIAPEMCCSVAYGHCRNLARKYTNTNCREKAAALLTAAAAPDRPADRAWGPERKRRWKEQWMKTRTV